MTDLKEDFCAYKEEVGKTLKAAQWPMTDNFGYEAIVSSLLSMLGMGHKELPYLLSRLGGLIDPTCIAVQEWKIPFYGAVSVWEMEDDMIWRCSMCHSEFPIASQESFNDVNSWEELVSNPYNDRGILRCDICGARVIDLCYLN